MTRSKYRQIPKALAFELMEAGLDQPRPSRELVAALNTISTYQDAKHISAKEAAAERKRRSRARMAES